MCLQMKENPPALHAMLNRTMNLPAAVCSQTDGRSLALENGRSKSGKKRLVSQKWKLDLQPCYDDANQMKTDKLGNQGYEDANVCTQAASLVNCLTESPWSGSSKTVDAVMSNCGVEAWFENVVNTDYMKLLELDDAVDEERYREAMEMPLSPTLPDIESHILGASGMPDSQYTIEQNFVGLESGKNSLVPFCTFHVVDVEGGSDWHMVNAPVNSFKEAGDDGHGFHDTVFAANACGLQIGESGAEMQVANQISIPERVGIEIPSASNGEHINERISKCCVVFSSTKDERSISKIVLSTITCIAQLSMASQKDWLVHKILLTLVMEDLLLGEKACVFFSVMLYNFSVVNLVDYENFSSGDSYSCADSFMVHIKTVMADAENRSIFSESFELDALVDLIEDFLIDGRVLVFSDVPSGAGIGSGLTSGFTEVLFPGFWKCWNQASWKNFQLLLLSCWVNWGGLN
ncbi:hypothetical protein NE237_032438 [Protea cynaroides]|uniref:Uncharacterized protein n=1 Tax=Protea cynaroides TaxID=273540 RepID=A0A9Q0L408_9MAGN|nr:hypothetical protein NE237_032438 [Protea cynaroides]